MIEFDPHHRIDLTGPWAGFSFLGDRLITPEGRELLPEDLAWLSLTACQAQEWRRMMEAARSAPSIDSSRNARNRDAGIRHHPATVVNLRDVVSQRGPALSPASVGEIVQRRARLAGLERDFGGHSLRSGFVTEASRQGVALPAIMQLTEHRSVSSVVGYFQAGGAADNPAARLLED